MAITGGHMEGSKFHNGQIVGPLETAPRETIGANLEDLLKSRQFDVTEDSVEPSGSRTFSARFPTLNIPAKIADRPTQIRVVLQLHVVASQVGEWDIDVCVRPASSTEFRHDLPRVRLAGVDQTWLPIVSGLKIPRPVTRPATWRRFNPRVR